MIEESISLVEEILAPFEPQLQNDFLGYRNHVYRVINFSFALGDLNDRDKKKIIVAGCFHDVGIWTGHTFDYLSPSIERAKEYLRESGLEEWTPEISLIIDQHHKLRPVKNDTFPLIEVFRRADLADFSLGRIKSGLSADQVREVSGRFPNAGFHKMLVKFAGRWICRHPLNPVPVLKW